MMNGDLITTLDYAALVDAHLQSGNALTIATQQRTATIDFGVLNLGEGDGTTRPVLGCLEKPTSEHTVSMGIYVVNPSLLRLIEPGGVSRVPDLVLKALAAGERVGVLPVRGSLARHRPARRLRARRQRIQRSRRAPRTQMPYGARGSSRPQGREVATRRLCAQARRTRGAGRELARSSLIGAASIRRRVAFPSRFSTTPRICVSITRRSSTADLS